MAEFSRFWGGTSIGDASLAPYDDDEFTDVIRDLLVYDRIMQGVFFRVGESCLAVLNPSGLTIRVGPGRALVDGKMYVNLDNVDLTLSAAPGAGTDYYHVVLRKDFAAQTVRAILLGPVNAGPATPPTQTDGTIWEIVIAEVRQTSAGVITVLDKRVPVNPQKTFQRLGGEDSTALSFVFANIPNFKHIRLEGILTGGVPAGSAKPTISVQFNGDTGNNYDDTYYRFPSGGVIAIQTGAARANIRFASMDSIATNAVTHMQLDIFQDGEGFVSTHSEGKSGISLEFFIGSGNWLNVGPVTSITILENTGLEWVIDKYQWTLSIVEG